MVGVVRELQRQRPRCTATRALAALWLCSCFWAATADLPVSDTDVDTLVGGIVNTLYDLDLDDFLNESTTTTTAPTALPVTAASCACDPLLDVSQFATCKVETNLFGLRALVIHNTRNHKCDPLDPASAASLDCAVHPNVHHHCQYYGDTAKKTRGHVSCRDIKDTWTGLSTPASTDYYIRILNRTKSAEVFCDMSAEPAETYSACKQCGLVDGHKICLAQSCCEDTGMSEVNFSSMSSDSQTHFSAENLAGFSRFCETHASAEVAIDFLDQDVEGFSECECCDCNAICSAGMYTSTEAHGGCKWCPAGKFSEDGASASCTRCPAGKYSADVDFDLESERTAFHARLADDGRPQTSNHFTEGHGKTIDAPHDWGATVMVNHHKATYAKT